MLRFFFKTVQIMLFKRLPRSAQSLNDGPLKVGDDFKLIETGSEFDIPDRSSHGTMRLGAGFEEIAQEVQTH